MQLVNYDKVPHNVRLELENSPIGDGVVTSWSGLTAKSPFSTTSFEEPNMVSQLLHALL